MAGPEPIEWREDILAGDFEQTGLALPGGDAATLVAHRGARTSPGIADDCVVLYIHGWSDYFFQNRVAEFWAGHGAAFYAVDLRRYGRNLPDSPPDVRPGYIEDLSDYDEEIDTALEIILAEHPDRRIVLAGHSTGGLIVSLWADRNPGRAAALVLNSPWLEFQLDAAARKAITPLLQWRSRTAADTPLRIRLPGYYMQSVLDSQGSLPYELDLKPAESFPIYPGWVRAVFAGHDAVQHGLSIDAPVLVQMSTRTVRNSSYTPDMTEADIVLDVDVLARRAPSLGTTVMIDRRPGAMHDIFLSGREVQIAAFDSITRFIQGYL